MMKIVVLDGFAANPGDLSWAGIEKFGSVIVYDRTEPQDVVSRIADAEIALVNKIVMTGEIMDACPNLKYIVETGTGFNNIDVQAARSRGIPVSNVPSYSTASVAQMVFAYLLEIAQRPMAHSDAVHKGKWTNCPDFCFRDYPIFELEGKTLGILGYGAIGQKVAEIACAFGMNVLAHSRTARPELETQRIKIASLDETLAGSDFITLHMPHNPDSDKIINADTIAKMRDGAIVINTARGACVNEADVRAALDSGKLGFYASDVLSCEPPKADNPLIGAPNCILTPHIAWMSFEARSRLMETLRQNVESYAKGAPINVVNP